MYGITSEHYAIDDGVLPIFDLHSTLEVKIDIEETRVTLSVGRREYEWPQAAPMFVQSGQGYTFRKVGRKETICKLSRRVA
jgi:hypothetical protein